MRILSLIAVVLFVSSLSAPARTGVVDDCEQEYDPDLKIGACTAMIRSGQWQGKELARAYFSRGNAYYDLGKLSQAIEDYDEALRLDPGFAYTYHNRGYAYAYIGSHARAIEDYEEALRLDPGYVKAYINRGNAYGNLGKHRRAIEDYDKALRLDADNAIAYRNRGVTYATLGEYDYAIEDFDGALRLDPDYVMAYNDRGFTYYNLGEYRRAIEDFDQALRLNPKVARARNNRGEAYNGLAWDLYLKGRNTEALGYVNRSLSDQPNSYHAIDIRAHVLAALGRRGEALAEFERVMRMGGAKLIRDYQGSLADHGYYRGAIDGVYTAQTKAALVACLEAGCRVVE